jgi:hypothetical protein
MSSYLQNPHLEGESFTWQASPVGVLLLHGFTATTSEVRPLARLLHEHGYTASGPLLPGFGTTPEDANRTRWEHWVEAATLAYQSLSKDCSSVFVGGESMGGLLASTWPLPTHKQPGSCYTLQLSKRVRHSCPGSLPWRRPSCPLTASAPALLPSQMSVGKAIRSTR